MATIPLREVRFEHRRGLYASMVSETLEDFVPEERHRIYKLLRLGFRFRPDWSREIMGIFAQVEEEAETDSSDRKPSPLSV